MRTSIISVTLEKDEPFRLFAYGDTQAGGVNTDRRAAAKFSEIVLESKRQYPNTYCVTMGDMADMIAHHDKKRFDPGCFDPSLRIKDLKDFPRAILELIDEIHGSILPLTIASVKGNHEASWEKYHSFDFHRALTERYAPPAGVTYLEGDKDMSYYGFMRVQFALSKTRRKSVDFSFNHGTGGGGYLPGYPTNKAVQVGAYSDADYCFMGHIHKLTAKAMKYRGLDSYGKPRLRQKWFGATGTFKRTYIDGHDDYFEGGGKEDADIGGLMAEVVFHRRTENGKDLLIPDLRLEVIDLDQAKWKYFKSIAS